MFQKCPEGVVHEDLFKDIYSKFFPHGSTYTIVYLLHSLFIIITYNLYNECIEFIHGHGNAKVLNCVFFLNLIVGPKDYNEVPWLLRCLVAWLPGCLVIVECGFCLKKKCNFYTLNLNLT